MLMSDNSAGGAISPSFRRQSAILADVRRAIGALEQSGNPEVADALALFVCGAPLDAALGLRDGWRDRLAESARDAALGALAAAQPRGLSCRARARTIANSIRLYLPAWAIDHASRRRPDGLRGELYDYLNSNGPRGEESIRRLLPGLLEDIG
jgi:hypothetical protein